MEIYPNAKSQIVYCKTSINSFLCYQIYIKENDPNKTSSVYTSMRLIISLLHINKSTNRRAH